MTGAQAAECPGPLTLFQYANGQVEGRQRDWIATHITTCSACAAKVRETGDDGRSLADALEPRDGAAEPVATVTTGRVALDVDELAEELGASTPQATTTTVRAQLPQPAGLRSKPRGDGPRPAGSAPQARRPDPPPLRPPAGKPPAAKGAAPPLPPPPPRRAPTPATADPLAAAVAAAEHSDGDPLQAAVAAAERTDGPSSADGGLEPLSTMAGSDPAEPVTPVAAPTARPSSPPAPRPKASSPPPPPPASKASSPPPPPRGSKPLPSWASTSDADLAEPVVHGVSSSASNLASAPSSTRRWLWVAIIVLAVAGLGGAGAVFVYPRLVAPGGLLASKDAAGTPTTAKKAGVVDGTDRNAPADSVPAAEDGAADGVDEAPEGAAPEATPAGAGEPDGGEPSEPPPPSDDPGGEPAEVAGDAADAAPPEGTAAPEPTEVAPADAAPPDPPAVPPPAVSDPPAATPAPTTPVPSNEIEVEPVGSRDPAQARLNARRGALALRRDKFESADAYFRAALAHEPRNATALGGLGALYYKQGHHRAALKFAAKAVNAAPHDPDLRILLGDTYLETKAFANARQQYKKAEALGHRSATARLAFLEEKLAGSN